MVRHRRYFVKKLKMACGSEKARLHIQWAELARICVDDHVDYFSNKNLIFKQSRIKNQSKLAIPMH